MLCPSYSLSRIPFVTMFSTVTNTMPGFSWSHRAVCIPPPERLSLDHPSFRSPCRLHAFSKSLKLLYTTANALFSKNGYLFRVMGLIWIFQHMSVLGGDFDKDEEYRKRPFEENLQMLNGQL